MFQDQCTNDQYHELVDAKNLTYQIRKENSIFFEVDGPYLAMILPASKEEGKKLKKRYAVFNFDGSLAELKGFEVKRRGELQIIKIFQSTVFEAFTKGETLQGCYEAVATVANYWLDVLYSKGSNMPDSELFDLISENKSMSKSLAEYEGQKSTSISTAKRLAEFLGDQMVKDAGLSCRYIISKKPDGAPVTERAIPVAIFEAETSVRQHYLRRWLKDSSLLDFDIRNVLDWDYYIERLGGTIQKIITIPAALQGISNPVPRVQHPDWLHKKIMEKTDVLKQRKMTEMFSKGPKTIIQKPSNGGDAGEVMDIEDGGGRRPLGLKNVSVSTVAKRKAADSKPDKADLTKNWRDLLGDPPKRADGLKEWIQFQKKKWKFQMMQRREGNSNKRFKNSGGVTRNPVTLGGFLQKTKRTLMDTPWQIIQIAETGSPGLFKIWALVGSDLHCIKLVVPRTFYVNQKTPKDGTSGNLWRKVQKTLPRSHPVLNLYEYSVPESMFIEHQAQLMADLSTPDIEGIYELQMPLDFRAVVNLGCLAGVERSKAAQLRGQDVDTFELSWLQFKTLASYQYLETNSYKYIYLYHHKSGNKAIWGLIIPAQKKGTVFVLDTVRSNQLPGLTNLYNSERASYISRPDRPAVVPESDYSFDIKLETDVRQVGRQLGRLVSSYLQEKRGPTILAVQSPLDLRTLAASIPQLTDIPVVPLHVADSDTLFNVLDWQRVGAKAMIKHYLKVDIYLASTIEQCRYFHCPAGNLPRDTTIFGADLFYARHLRKQNFVLWTSNTDRPDFGGKEADDNRLLTEMEDGSSVVISNSGFYRNTCVELEIDALAVTTLLQSNAVQELEGAAGAVAFDAAPQANLEELLSGGSGGLASYDETALAAPAFRVLRAMVGSWMRDVSVYKNLYADYQIVHFYRWLRNPSSLLFDPALRKTLLQLMKKLFFHLVSEFKRLGAVIVYADFNRIILNTKKRTVRDAVSYINYITENIKNKEIFHSIEVVTGSVWEVLMWCDPANYAAVPGDLKELEEKEETLADEDDDDATVDVKMTWNIAEYLPEAGKIRDNFHRFVVGYVTAVHSFLCEERERVAPGETPVRRRRMSQTPSRSQKPSGEQITMEEFCVQLVGGELSQLLFKFVDKINKKFPQITGKDEKEVSVFPELPGSHIRQTFPALEFVKAVCKVLSLDLTLTDEVRRLRRNLLRLINVGEFDSVAEWKDPSISFVLSEVICKSCNHCRDIDLCKDPNKEEKDGKPVFVCAHPTCKAAYETEVMQCCLYVCVSLNMSQDIESMMIDSLQRKYMGYFLQDLTCSKCGEVAASNMVRRCKCAGEFKTTVRAESIGELLKAFLGLSDHYHMHQLKEQVLWMFKMNPNFAREYEVDIESSN